MLFVSLLDCLHVAEVFLTAFQALVWNAHMKDGETVLVHAVRDCTVVLCVALFLGHMQQLNCKH